MPPRILVIDDDTGARTMLDYLLTPEGYEVHTAENGVRGLAHMGEWAPDIILCDLMMPEMNGLEFCRRVRSTPAFSQIPLLLLTALSDRIVKLESLEAGADEFITKPIDPAELRARVRTAVQLNRYRRLNTERARFHWALEQSHDGYLILSPEGTILFANARARLYLGLNNDYTDAPPFLDLARNQYALEPEEAWAIFDPKSAGARYFVRPETPTAQAIWLQVSYLDNPDPDMNESIVHLRDISAQILTQSRWGSFVQVLSHKLRTPINNILALTEMLHENDLDMPPQEVRDVISLTYENALRLRNQLVDILDYLHAPQQANTKLTCSVGDLSALIKQVAQVMDLSLALTVAPKVYGRVLPLTPQALESIVREIFENSVKFHPQHTPTLDVEIHLVNDSIRVQFADNGIHLSPEQLIHVWEPFYQAEKYSTGEILGTGLGLALVSLLVWNVGGSCHMMNRPDKPGILIQVDLIPIPN